MLSVDNLSFSYDGKKEILKDLSLSLNRGEIVGLMAPSGFGKSTLGKAMAGYLKVKRGKISVDGVDINDLSGFLPVQMVHQAPEKNVNIRWKVEKILNEGWWVDDDVKEKFGIEESFLKKFPTELSGGELQRICIARVLSSETKYLIADEVTTMLDSITQAQICHLLKHFAKEHNLGILFISHNEALIDALCDRKIDLRDINKI